MKGKAIMEDYLRYWHEGCIDNIPVEYLPYVTGWVMDLGIPPHIVQRAKAA
jgi:hypothetical protein